MSSAPEMAAAMKAFIARGSAPRHARFGSHRGREDGDGTGLEARRGSD